MQKNGMSKEAIIKQFLSGALDGIHNDTSQPTDHGHKLNHPSSTHKQKEREKLKDKLKNLLEDPTSKPDDVFRSMMSKLSHEEQAKIKEMENKGMSKEAIIKHFLSGGLDAVDKGHSQPSDHGQIRP